MEEKGIIEIFLATDVQTIIFTILELAAIGIVLYFSNKA